MMSSIPPWFKLPDCSPLDRTYKLSGNPVVVIGSGLAGCHIAFELATRGIKVVLVDASDAIAAGASGNSASIVKPFVTRSPGRSDQFYHAAFDFLLDRFDSDKRLRDAAQFKQCGVLQLFERAYPTSNLYSTCSPEEASMLAGVRIESSAVFFKQGGWLNPAALCLALAQHRHIEILLNHNVHSISENNNNWLIEFDKNSHQSNKPSTPNSMTCDTLILANGCNANRFRQTAELPIIAARGQSSQFTLTEGAVLKTVVTGKRYAIPDGNQVVVGASFIRNNQNRQLCVSEHADNLAGLHTLLPSLKPDPTPQSGFCAIRATTPDRLPVVGPMPTLSTYQHNYAQLKDGVAAHRFPNASYAPGLFIIGGFGSRGVVSTPYCAKLLADYLTGAAHGNGPANGASVDNLSSWSALLHPARFKIRNLRRARYST